MSLGVWVGLALMIAANGLYVAAEFGAVGVRRSRIRRLAEDGNAWARRLLPYVEDTVSLDRYVGASQIGITVSSLALGALAQATVTVELAPLVAGAFELDALTALSVTAVGVLALLTACQLILGELVPKAIALQYPTATSLATVVPMRWSLAAFWPMLFVLNGAAIYILRLFRLEIRSHRHLHSPQEIEMMIAKSRDGGLLEPDEQQRLRRVLRLGMRPARDLMVPRARMTTLGLDASWEDVVRTVSGSPFSRLPVTDPASGRIVGMLRVKDLVVRYVSEGPLPLARLMRPIVELREDLAADRVITRLRERRMHLAVLVDHTGDVTGLITIQDLLGELLGHVGPEPPRAAP
jgi:CBS domain containing-hemolysin-like protein